MKKNILSKTQHNEEEVSTKYVESLKRERDILKKQNALFHNALMDINMSLCRDLTAQQRLEEIINKIQSTRINVAQITPKSTIVLV